MLALGKERPLAGRQRHGVRFGARDPLLVHRHGRLGSGPTGLPIASCGLDLGPLGGKPVPAGAKLARPRLPGRERVAVVGIASLAGGGRPGGDMVRRDSLAESLQLRGKAVGLGRLPAGFANGRLERPSGRPILFLCRPAHAGRPRLLGTRRIEDPPRLEGLGCRCGDGSGRRGALGGQPLHLAAQSLRLGPSLERRIAPPQADRQLADDGRTVADDRQPADRQLLLDRDRRPKIRDDDGPGEDARDDAAGIASDGRCERPAAQIGNPLEQPALAGLGWAAARRRPGGGDLAQDQQASLAGQVRRSRTIDEIGPGDLVENGFDRRPVRGLDDELLVHAPASAATSGAGNAARFLFGQAGVDGAQPALLLRKRRPGG